MNTVLIPPLMCSARVYDSVIDAVWSRGSVTIGDTLHDSTIAGMATRILREAPEKFALLGTSMGGYVALEIVRQAPERLLGLALVSTTAGSDSHEMRIARRRQSQLVEQGGFSDLVDAAFPTLVSQRNESDPELLRAWRDMAAAVGPEHFLQQQEAVTTRSDAEDVLGGISCPTFVIHGADDRLVPCAQGIRTAAKIPSATLRLVEKAGHFLFLERPDAARDVVDEFLDSLG